MCFSATVSFATGALLLPVGAYAVQQARWRDSRYLPLAAFPIFFGMQQGFEGALWLGLEGGATSYQTEAALGFLFFAFLFWPFMVPFAVWRLESGGPKGRKMGLIVLLGLLFGAVLYLPLLWDESRVMPAIVHHSITYPVALITDGRLPRPVNCLIYALIVSLPLLFASHRPVRVYGGILVVSVVLSAGLFHYAFTSVWCFFAALLSLYTVRIVRALPG